VKFVPCLRPFRSCVEFHGKSVSLVSLCYPGPEGVGELKDAFYSFPCVWRDSDSRRNSGRVRSPIELRSNSLLRQRNLRAQDGSLHEQPRVEPGRTGRAKDKGERHFRKPSLLKARDGFVGRTPAVKARLLPLRARGGDFDVCYCPLLLEN